MKLILSPKDNLGKIILSGVVAFSEQVNTLVVIFEDGRTRNYPFCHIWYYESNTKDHVAKV